MSAEIPAGLDLKSVVEGARFEIQQCQDQEATPHWDKKQYIEKLETHSFLQAIDANIPDDFTPFAHLATQMFPLYRAGEIKKKVCKQGYAGSATPKPGCYVKIQYNAYEEYEAQPFDSTYARNEPFGFTVGGGQALEGLDVAVQSMRVAEHAQFLVQPQLAYRSDGLDRVKPGAVVLFDVELLQILEEGPAAARDEDRGFAAVLEQSAQLNAKGKARFRLKDYSEASREYSAAANRLENAVLRDFEEQVERDKLLYVLYSNLLVCNAILERPQLGCFFANKIFHLVRDNPIQVSAKVYYNNAKCKRMLGDFSFAEKQLRIADKIKPGAPEIQAEFEQLNKAKEKYAQNSRRIAQAFIR